MKKPILFLSLILPLSTFGETMICSPDEGYGGNDTMIKRSIGDPLPLNKIPGFNSFENENFSLDFENKIYKTKTMNKKILNVYSIGDEVVGTVIHGGGDGFFQLHYNKRTKKLFRTSNGGVYHDYLKKYVTMIEVNTYDCR